MGDYVNRNTEETANDVPGSSEETSLRGGPEQEEIQYNLSQPLNQPEYYRRQSSPDLTHDQRLRALNQQISRRTGVPEVSLSTFCIELPQKRSRTDEQKRNKRLVENAGGSCFFCVLNKRKVAYTIP